MICSWLSNLRKYKAYVSQGFLTGKLDHKGSYLSPALDIICFVVRPLLQRGTLVRIHKFLCSVVSSQPNPAHQPTQAHPANALGWHQLSSATPATATTTATTTTAAATTATTTTATTTTATTTAATSLSTDARPTGYASQST